MTAKELSAVSKLSPNAIRGRYYRFTKTNSGWSKTMILPDDFIQFVMSSEPNRKSKTKTESKKETQAKPKTKSKVEPEPNRTEPEDTSKDELTEPKTQSEPELKQIKPKKAEQFDLGAKVFFHPTAQFLFVMVILSAGAYIFASLASKLYPDEFNIVTFAMFFGVGFLVDGSGIIFARNYQREDKWDDATLVHTCLFVLLAVQVWIESSYMFYESDFSWSGFAVVCVRPLGQFVYSEMYLNSKR